MDGDKIKRWNIATCRFSERGTNGPVASWGLCTSMGKRSEIDAKFSGNAFSQNTMVQNI